LLVQEARFQALPKDLALMPTIGWHVNVDGRVDALSEFRNAPECRVLE
jgi:hypothetical protein